MIKLLWFICSATQAYIRAGKPRAQGSYVALNYHGVPFVAFIVARDREAWRVTDLALNHAATLRDTN